MGESRAAVWPDHIFVLTGVWRRFSVCRYARGIQRGCLFRDDWKACPWLYHSGKGPSFPAPWIPDQDESHLKFDIFPLKPDQIATVHSNKK